jgi:hypothetical protein
MTFATIVALYGAVLSSILAVFNVAKYFQDSRNLVVAKQVSYFGEDDVCYTFVVTNVGSRPLTILDCTTLNWARRPNGRLAPDWGVEPSKIADLLSEDEEALNLPIVVSPGGALLLTLRSGTLVEQYSRYARSRIKATEHWVPTNKVTLEIQHSLSKRYHSTAFRLEGNELQKVPSPNQN